MLDPGSTVREGEFANAQNSAGIPERVRGVYNNAINGERLSDVTRGDFVKQAKGQYNAALSGYKRDVSEFRRVAEKSGLDPELVILELATGGVQNTDGGGVEVHDEALSWAQQNPADPRAKRILKLRGQ